MSLRTRSVVSKFLAFCRASKAARTADYYAHHLAKLVKRVGNKLACRLKSTDLTAWAKTWHETQAVTRCFHWAANEEELIRRSPFKKVKLPPMRGRERILSPQQIAKFLRGLRPAPRLFFLAMRETFARPQEIRAARVCDLKSENPRENLEAALLAGRALIVLRNYKSRERRSDPSRHRVLLVTKRLGRAILRLGRLAPTDTSPIFLNTLGKQWTKNAIRCVVRRSRRTQGIERDETGETLCAYHIRHSVATEVAAGGMVDRSLADLLGHADVKTTSRYQHLTVGHLRSSLERAKAVLRPARPTMKPRKRSRSKPTSRRPRA